MLRMHLVVGTLLVLASTCSLLEASGGGGHKKPSGHGAKPSAHGSKDSGHGKKESGHGHGKKDAKPAHGAKGHGEKSDGHGADHGDEEASAAAAASAAAHLSDVEAILSLITAREKKHDPRLYVEVDLGEFRVTRPGQSDDVIFLVKFHIYGVLHEQEQTKFDDVLAGRLQRMRDAVLSVIHKSELEQLSDPSLDTVKTDLIAAINRVLENDCLRDVAFSTFSMERM